MLQKEKSNTILMRLLIVLLFAMPGDLRAQFTSTITCFFPKEWEGKQAMVVSKPL